MPEKYKTVDAPRMEDVGAKYSTIPLPDRVWYQIADLLTRRDELLEAVLRALNVTIEQNNDVIALLAKMAGVEIPAVPAALAVVYPGVVIPGAEVPGVAYFRDYLTEDQLDNKGVVNAATPVQIEVLEIMGRRARFGFVYSETGTLNIKINNKSPIPVKAADFLPLGDLRLEIEEMRIETDSVADITFRLLLV